MGTAKRERQKANRELRRAEEARQQRTDKMRRTVLTWGGGILAAFVAVLAIAYFTGAFDNDDSVATDTTPSTISVASTPTSGSGALTGSTPEATAPTSDATEALATAAPSGPPAECPPIDGSAPKTQTFSAAQQMCIDPAKSYTAEIVTNKGTLTADLLSEKAPKTVNNFVTLSRYHYYDGISCHRIIPGFMAQCGDPTGTGTGGPGYDFEDELPAAGEYKIGSLAMANSGPNTNGSQFFIITGDQGVSLPPNYSLFGQVTDGLDTTLPALDKAGNPADNGVPPLEPVTIESITITEK